MSQGTQAFFPLAGGEGKITQLRCLNDPDPSGKSMIAQVIGKNSLNEKVSNILGAARGFSPSLLGKHVVVRFPDTKNSFDGESYGLALAIADRLLFEGMTGINRRIYATGLIRESGSGEIDAVDPGTFLNKVQLIAQNAGQGDVFVFPFDNWRDSDPEVVNSVKAMKNNGVVVAHARHMNELAFLWAKPKPAKEQQPQSAFPFWTFGSQDLALAVASGLLVAVLAVTLLTNLD
ncbi:conserved hypothetical protein [uncultured Gammaproteobacteria bacterium]